MKQSIEQILDFYIDPNNVCKTDVTQLQYRNAENFTKIQNIYVGTKCTVIFESKNPNLSPEEIQHFRVKCFKFYVECAHQIYSRFPFNSEYVQSHVEFLDRKKI